MTIDYSTSNSAATTCLKETVRANKIPRQKVVNIKLKETHTSVLNTANVSNILSGHPSSTTNKENFGGLQN